MRRFWLFRSNLIPLEYYHKYKDLETFKNNCHDYYMLLPLWLLENNYCDEITVWRLTKDKKDDIVFDVNGKKYIQKWVRNFKETFDYPSPDVSFWRGGFKEYDAVTKVKPKHFGLKLYLGAGVRQYPQYGGKYDAFLMEDERDFDKNKLCIPFYKTASPHIFHPMKSQLKYDICWPCNFTQIKYKGQAFFMDQIIRNNSLKKLTIVHCGNKPEVGRRMANERGITNIQFMGPVDRPKLNEILNQSRFGLNLSNKFDGCPRVSTEVLMSGTPLILRDSVRLLNYYKKDGQGVINVNDENVGKKIIEGVVHHHKYKYQVMKAIEGKLSFHSTNQKNLKEWQKI